MAFASANPTLDAIPDNTTAENSTLVLNITYSQYDNGSLSLTDNSTFGTLSSITNTSAVFTIAPDFDDAGTYDVLINASDGNSSNSTTFTLTVTNTNRAPAISISEQGAVAGIAKTIDLNATASDLDDIDNSALNYTAVADSDNVTCTITGSNLTFTVDEGYVGNSYCNVTVNDNDANAKTASTRFKITSQAQNPDVTISQSPATPQLIKYSGGDSVNFNLTLTEAGNMPLTGVSFVMGDLKKGDDVISFATTQTGISIADNGKYDVQLTATLPADANISTGDYTAQVNVSYEGLNKTGSVKVNLREPSYSFSYPSSVALGSNSQERNTTTSPVSFVLSNTGDYALNNFNISSTASSDYVVKFSEDNTNYYDDLTFSQLGLSDSNKNKTIYVKCFVPEKQNSIITDIGNIIILSDNYNATISTFTLQAESKLEIDDVDIKVNGKSSDLDDGETEDNINIGDELEFLVDVENLYDSSSDIRMEDVFVTITIYGIDDGDDLEEESSSFDIKDGKTEKDVSIDFEVPENADEGTYSVLIEAEGEDEEGADHYTSWTVYIDVEKEDDDVRITRAELGTEEMQCIRDTTLNVVIENLGSDDQEDVTLIIKATQLGINFKKSDIDLDAGYDDEDSEFHKSLPVNIDDDFKAGTYTIEVTVEYEDGINADTEIITLVVTDCSMDMSSDKEEEKADNVVLKTDIDSSLFSDPTASQIVSGQSETVSKSSFTDSGFYVTLLVLLNVAAIAGIGYFAVAFLIKP